MPKSLLQQQYNLLSEDEILQLHEISLKILQVTGFLVQHLPTLELLESKGAQVDWDNRKVFLPPDLVLDCVNRAPTEFYYYGLEEGKEIYLAPNQVHFGSGGKALYVLDLQRQKRPATLWDIASLGKLANVMEYVNFHIIPTNAHDVNVNILDINGFFHSLRNTGKPVMGGIYNAEGLERVIEMASFLAGSKEKLQKKPFVGFITAITSPLKIEETSMQILTTVAQNGLPLVISTAPIAGATSPITLSGTLAQQNAEALMGIVLSQIINPGTPVFYSAVPCTMDMRSGSFLMGSIESGMMNAALTQMAKYYQIPCYITVGVTDSKLPDAQAAHESATTCMLAALAGGNFIHQAFGFLDGALTMSYAQFIIDNDIVGSCLRVLQGMNINPETLAFDVINDVGPGGNFLTQEHTLKYMRSESFIPRVSNRQDYQNWLTAGGKDSWQTANEIGTHILEGENHHYISKEKEKELKDLFPEIIEPEES